MSSGSELMQYPLSISRVVSYARVWAQNNVVKCVLTVNFMALTYPSWILICMYTYTGSAQPFPFLPLKYLYTGFSDCSPHGEMFHQDSHSCHWVTLKPFPKQCLSECQLFGTAELPHLSWTVFSWFPSQPSPPPFPLGHLLHICSAHLLVVAMGNLTSGRETAATGNLSCS